MSRDVHYCTHWLITNHRPPPSSPHIRTRNTRALLVSKDRRHFIVTPWFKTCTTAMPTNTVMSGSCSIKETSNKDRLNLCSHFKGVSFMEWTVCVVCTQRRLVPLSLLHSNRPSPTASLQLPSSITHTAPDRDNYRYFIRRFYPSPGSLSTVNLNTFSLCCFDHL